MQKQTPKQAFLLYLKGVAMGAADIVPGVSGGTIAFITGIYQQLIDSIGAIGPDTLRILFKDGPIRAWHSFNGNFLLVLMLGILTSAVSLAKLISGLLETQPELLWSFFFGLILISAVHIGKQIKQWSFGILLALLAGVAIAYAITAMAPAQIPANTLTIFAAGSVAICAMILPGISGSFILLLMGMYAHIIGAIKSFDLMVLAVFGAGCITGLLLFTRLLSWLLHRFQTMTLAVLTGFMIGSLNKVWPWKQTLSYRINSHGEEVAFQQANVLPTDYASITGSDPHIVGGVLLMIVAIIVVLGVEKLTAQRDS